MAHVAFIGTGLLGSGMVEAMLRKGETVTAWNRTAAKARALEPFGARVASTPEEAVRGADRIHMVLSDDGAVDAMIERIDGAVGASILIDHTTTSPSGTKARLQRAHARGHRMLHAPVFMTPQMCRDCIGLMLVSGRPDVFDVARPVLEAMTGDVWYVGEREDLAAAYKIFGNSMVFALTAGIADVFAMARNLDVPLADAAALFTRFKPGGMIAPRAQKIASGDRTATFELTMARKDVQLMLDAAGAERLLVLPAVAQRMDEAIAAGRGKEDSGAIAT